MAVYTFMLSAKRQNGNDVDFVASMAIAHCRTDELGALRDAIFLSSKDRWPKKDGWRNHKVEVADNLSRQYLLTLLEHSDS